MFSCEYCCNISSGYFSVWAIWVNNNVEQATNTIYQGALVAVMVRKKRLIEFVFNFEILRVNTFFLQ